ncbi:RNA 2',3'-cyclic phosphodiesterase [Parasphingopyxis lamellibrachiae]|uniref:RNA 2',3'-cyclic phosphodiesterase n=1 Tax=Parasphingopyxis lamellibrachiae TaxID=680125 RepID=A0A3D9FDV8_9SPHN|nr:RNA 2',3'-cyclic phosphodiesterase [Parasphingopyxis lamellibrachiae]RED16015.1 2'-5' RNA ligase [Parasphingopyxis lamellibrachiae]
MHRLFVAIRPPHAIREQLLDLMHDIAAARWQSDDQLHLTLRFIGSVERPMAEDIATALGQTRVQPFEIALNGVGSFEKGGKLTALWAGIRALDDLKRLRDKMESVFRALGLEPDHRAFLPHITIARLNGSTGPIGNFMQDNLGLTSEPFVVDHFDLIESFLGPAGARYESVARYPFG